MPVADRIRRRPGDLKLRSSVTSTPSSQTRAIRKLIELRRVFWLAVQISYNGALKHGEASDGKAQYNSAIGSAIPPESK